MLKNFYKYIFHKSATLMNKNQLGSIDLSDVIDVELTENEIKERNVNIANSFKYIEPAIKKLIIAQQEFMSRECANEEQLLFGRGVINGLFLLKEEFEKYKSQHEEDTKPKEKFNPHKII